jgi:hypothetical protein
MVIALALAAMIPVVGAAGAPAPQPLPFSAGELATYQVKLGALSVGTASLAVTGMETVQGQPAFHTVMTVRGGNALVRVNDLYESWIDADGLFSRRFHQEVHEARYRRDRTYEFFAEQGTYLRENGETGTLPTNQPLDDLSFIYFARTLPLEVGSTYTLPRYFKESGNPVVLQVLRRETVTVPAGRFRTLVVHPVIRTEGMFGEGGRAEVYFSDDRYRIPVLIRSRVPVVGSLSMHMRAFRKGN